MNIEQAKQLLDIGHTLELVIPAHDKYMAAMYHVLVTEHKEYRCSVFYPNMSVKWVPIFAYREWTAFLLHLPNSLQQSTEWVVL